MIASQFIKAFSSAGLVTALFVPTLVGNLPTARAASYYISQSTGNDNSDGLSAEKPWKTLAKASIDYQPGDEILLKCGDTWDEELRPLGEGTAAKPITIAKISSRIAAASACLIKAALKLSAWNSIAA